MKTALDAALRYAGKRGWPVFPCQWQGERRKQPLIDHWPDAATADAVDRILSWWTRWPLALIGLPTGAPCGLVVLDIDTKRGVDGWQTLAELEKCPIRPAVPSVITASGGAHLYYQRPEDGLRNTAGRRGRGIGPGLDWRGDGGYVILPSPGSGYRWSARHFGNCAPKPVPPELLPKIRVAASTDRPARPVERVRGLSPYAEAALDKAARAIVAAPAGEQETTLNAEAFAIGTLAGAGIMPIDFARKVLLWAARQMRDHDHRHPWHLGEIELKVARAFSDGMRQPRCAGGHHAA